MFNVRKAFSVLLVLMLLVGLYTLPASAAFGDRITVSGTQFMAGGARIWINGCNTPWNSWNDFGGSFDYNWWDNHFATLHSNGINATRIWISCNGEVGINISTAGYVSGCTSAFWSNLDSLFQIAQNRQVYIKATLISFDHFSDYHANYQSWRNMITNSGNIDSMVNNYVIPFVNRYKNNPWLFCIDLCNEPDWIYENANCGNIAWSWIQTYFAKAAVAIHANSSIPVAVGIGMAPKYGSSSKGTNVVSDSALSSKVGGDSRAKVDFWIGHHYDWMDSIWGNPFYMSPSSYGMDGGKPCLIGECPSNGTAGHTTTSDYESGYVNGWQGAMGWTSNGVDSMGSLTQLGPATNAFRDNHYSLVFPAGGGSTPTPTASASPTATATPTTTPVRNAFSQIEAENYDSQSGIQTESCSDTGGGMNIGYIENGDYTVYNKVDFGTGATGFTARVASATSGGNIEVRLDSISGTLVGTCAVAGTGGWQTWTTKTCSISGATGQHNLYLKFTGGSGALFNVNWFVFTAGVNATPTATATVSPTATPTATATTSVTAVVVDNFDSYASDSALQSAWPRVASGNGLTLYRETTNKSQGTYGMRYVYANGTAGFTGATHAISQNWTGRAGISLWIKPDGSGRTIAIQFKESSGEYWEYTYTPSGTSGVTVTIPWASFAHPGWYSGGNGVKDLGSIVEFGLYENGNGAGTLYFDDIKAY